MDVAFKRSPLGSEGERFRLRTGFLRAFGIAVLFVARFQRYRDFRREKDARERFLQELALLTAGAAHEMGTPLSTMTFVVDDLRRCDAPPPTGRKAWTCCGSRFRPARARCPAWPTRPNLRQPVAVLVTGEGAVHTVGINS